MFVVLLVIAVTVLLLGGAAGLFYAAWRSVETFERVMFASLGAIGIVLWLLLAALQSGQLATVPPGCYRISDTTSTGVAVGAKGAVPVVMSGRTYEPIPCP